jgi:hypothetical protein
MLKPWLTGLVLLAALIVQGCAAPGSASGANGLATQTKPMPDFGNKSYSY